MVSDPNRVTVGIDAAVVANHQVAIRGSTGGEAIAEDFAVAPNLEAVAGQSIKGAIPAARIIPALVNGTAGAVITVGGRTLTVMGFTVSEWMIAEIDAIADPERVGRIAAAVLEGGYVD